MTLGCGSWTAKTEMPWIWLMFIRRFIGAWAISSKSIVMGFQPLDNKNDRLNLSLYNSGPGPRVCWRSCTRQVILRGSDDGLEILNSNARKLCQSRGKYFKPTPEYVDVFSCTFNEDLPWKAIFRSAANSASPPHRAISITPKHNVIPKIQAHWRQNVWFDSFCHNERMM